MNVDSATDTTESENGCSDSEDDHDDLDCVVAMEQMSRKEVDVAFILCNLRRRIVPHLSPHTEMFSSA